MSSIYFHFIFAWEDQEKEYNNDISTFNDMISVIRKIYLEKFSEETSIRVYFMDIDGESFEIQSQKEFQIVQDYFRSILSDGKSPNVNKIRIKIIQQKFDISKLFLSSKANLAESNIEEFDENKNFESILPKNKRALLGTDTNAMSAIISKEMIGLKELMASNNKEIVKNFREIIEQNISNSDEKIDLMCKEISFLKEKLETREKNQNLYSSNLKYERISLEIKGKVEENLQDINKVDNIALKKELKENKNMKDREFFLFYEGESDVYICSICFENPAKYTCVMCENLFLCKGCEYSDSHSIHPRLSISSIPHYSVENISKTAFSKNNFHPEPVISNNNLYQFDKNLFYFKSNRKFFSKKFIQPVTLEITIDKSFLKLKNNDENILQFKVGEEMKIPLKLKNLSNISIMPFELLITTNDSRPLIIENKLLNTILESYESVNLDILVNATMFLGEFNIELLLFHLMRKLEYNPVCIRINVAKKDMVQN